MGNLQNKKTEPKKEEPKKSVDSYLKKFQDFVGIEDKSSNYMDKDPKDLPDEKSPEPDKKKAKKLSDYFNSK